MGTDRPRFSITVSEELYDQINKFQHENRIATQTKAISKILQIGINALVESPISDKLSRVQTEFEIPEELAKIIEFYNDMNIEGQHTLYDSAESLSYNPKYKKGNSISKKATG